MMKRIFRITLVICCCLANTVQAQTAKPLFDYWKYYSDHENALYHHMADRALQQLDERKALIGQLESRADWDRRRQSVREKLDGIMGPFPERTPLNPEVTGTIREEDYRIEKVVYESQPGFYVTAALFIPNNLQGKAPAIIYCSGHTFEGFRSKVYQHMILNLVRKGFVVLAFDPVGQGERLQYLDDSGEGSIFTTPTHEHSYPGGQCFISGSSIARHMIWDGIRSVDYLVSRPEVDPARIGITGRSGGGTQSTYIAAFDERIRAAAPECYITGFEYLFKSIGPQDAEQNLPGLLSERLDLADLLEVRAPLPLLIISTINDFFSIQGAREAYREVKKAYAAMGYPDRVSMSEDIGEHETTLKNRIALYRFFQEHLEQPGEPEDLEVPLYDPADLRVTSTGQVMTSYDAESIYSLNRKEILPVLQRNKSLAEDGDIDPDQLRDRVIQHTGYRSPDKKYTPVFSGREVSERYLIEKYLVPGSGNYQLPVLVLKPVVRSNGKAVIIYNPEGKQAEIGEENLAGWLTSNGYTVVLPDIPGFGELGPGYLRGDAYMEHTSYNQWFAGILTGKSLTRLRMEDMAIMTDFIEKELSFEPQDLYGIARDVLTPELLHYQAMTGGMDRIALIKPLVSYQSLVLNRDYHPRWIQSAVPGAILHYDLPDLAVSLAETRLMMIDIVDQDGQRIRPVDAHPEILALRARFRRMGKAESLLIRESEDLSFEELFNTWLEIHE